MIRHIKNSLAVLLGQVAAAGGGLIGVRILTEYLSPTEYGHLTLGLTLALVVNQLLMGPLGAGVTRFYATALEKKESADFLMATLRLILVVISVVILVAIIAMTILWATNIEGWIVMVAIAAIFSVISGLNAIINGLWLSNNQQIILSINQGLEPWLRIIGGIGSIILIKASGQAAFAGYIAGVLILLLSQIYLFNRYDLKEKLYSYLLIDRGLKLKLNSVWQSKIFNYSYPFAIWGIFTTMHIASDRWILQWYHGAEEVAYYAVLYQIGYMPMTLLTSMGAQLLTPILFGMAGDGNDHTRINKVSLVTTRAVWVALLFMSLVILVGWLFSDVILSLLAAMEYRHLHSYLPLFLFAGGLFGVGQVASLYLQSKNNTKKILKIKIAVALVGILCNILLGGRLGFIGVLISLTVSSFLYLFLMVRTSE